VLVDGRVAATYRITAGNSKRAAIFAVTTLVSVTPPALDQLEAEATALLATMGDGYTGGTILID